MVLFAMMENLLRDRESLYKNISESRALRSTLMQLMLVFLVTAALYGAVMGSFRVFHPSYSFSDFELTAAGVVHQGKIAGMDPATSKVFAAQGFKCETAECVRFNVSRPSDPATVVSVAEEKGFIALTLAPDFPLQEPRVAQIPLLTAFKTPLIFLLTLLVCAPALYVLNLAFNIRLRFLPVMTLFALGLAGTGTMLAVLVPVAALFSVVTESYHFMKVFHLLAFMVAGVYGVKLLREGLLRLAPTGSTVSGLMTAWLLLYCLVGSQVTWMLKPFLGTPYLPATPPFRIEAGNIYVSAFESLQQIFR